MESKLKAESMDAVGELPELGNLLLRESGYPHLPDPAFVPAPKADAWNEVGTKPDHPCLCETRTEGGSEGWYQFWNGEFFCTESMAQATAIEWGNRNIKSCTKEVQWRELQT